MSDTELQWPERLVVVRHGESEHNLAHDLYEDGFDEAIEVFRDVRDADIELTERGEWQARQAGEFLAGTAEFDYCFSSTYERALQTAEGIIDELPYDLEIFEDDRLREKEFGRFHGMTKEEIRDSHPEEFKSRDVEGKYFYRPPRGENYMDVRQRIRSFMDKLARDYGGDDVLVVTHQIPYKLFRAEVEHLQEDGVLALDEVPNCGIEEFRADTSEDPEGRIELENYIIRPYSPEDYDE